MNKLITLCVATLAITGCTKTEYGPELTEPGKVAQLIYVPEGHGSDIAVGIGSKGAVTVTPIDIRIPARYGIVFECQHGSFAIEKHPEIWKTLHQGQEVTIRYRVKYNVSDGHRTAVDLDFLGVEQSYGAKSR